MSMSIGLSGLNAATTDINTTANNVANVKTNGFKNSRVQFGDLVSGQGGIGVKTQAINQLFQQGTVTQTFNEGQNGQLDLAINGGGFFKVKNVVSDATVDPPLYTRAGSFHVDAKGFVVNELGQRLQDKGGADIQAPASATAGLFASVASIAPDGTVTFNDAAPTTVTVGIFNFPNLEGLQAVGNTQWAATSTSGAEVVVTAPEVMGGFLEDSNVDLTAQLVNMIIAQRNFQANAQTITTNNTMTQTIINIR